MLAIIFKLEHMNDRGSSERMDPYSTSHILWLSDRLHNTTSGRSSFVIGYKNTTSGGSSIM